MNDLLQFSKIIPTSALVLVALVRVIVKALPESSQFFGDLLPYRRRLARTRASLETIKAKVDAIEIAQKYNIQPVSTVQEAVQGELGELLKRKIPKTIRSNTESFGVWLSKALYSLFIAALFIIFIFGALSSSRDFVWEHSLFIPLAVSFLTALIGSLNRPKASFSLHFDFEYLVVATFFGFIGGMLGLVIAVPTTGGVIKTVQLLSDAS